ncbi:MAG: hypothetical protein U0W40_15885 [Acidimicrobiia bacterium]
MTALPTWAEQLRMMEGVVDTLMEAWRPDGYTEAELQDMNKLALSILSEGYLCRVYTDAKRPVFMPLWNYAYNQGGPDPDYVYSTCEVDTAGTYRISGFRGTTRFVEITQQGFDMMSPGDMSSGGAVPATHDLDEVALDGEGYFSAILKQAARPGTTATGGSSRPPPSVCSCAAARATGATSRTRVSRSSGSTTTAPT